MRIAALRRLVRDLHLAKVSFGATRFVVVRGDTAVKFARGHVGQRCNLFEHTTWARYKDDTIRGPHLCPVLWCALSGCVLIMQAAEPLDDDQHAEAMRHTYEQDDWWDYRPDGDCAPFEPKIQDWGVIDGRIVAVDYASPATHWFGD